MPAMFPKLRPVLPLLALAPVFLLGSAAAPADPQAPAPQPLLGFSEERAAAQRDLEARFDATLRTENLRTWMQRLSSRPHPVGSP